MSALLALAVGLLVALAVLQLLQRDVFRMVVGLFILWNAVTTARTTPAAASPAVHRIRRLRSGASVRGARGPRSSRAPDRRHLADGSAAGIWAAVSRPSEAASADCIAPAL